MPIVILYPSTYQHYIIKLTEFNAGNNIDLKVQTNITLKRKGSELGALNWC